MLGGERGTGVVVRVDDSLHEVEEIEECVLADEQESEVDAC